MYMQFTIKMFRLTSDKSRFLKADIVFKMEGDSSPFILLLNS